MRLSPSDPDVQTLYGRIANKKIDLQPDFQRGEVWSIDKKKALIDTILRGWHVPPIHIIVIEETGAQEVLDGQQRLVAIRDFMDGEFTVDGYCEPLNKEMNGLHGMRYSELPPKYKNNFDNYAIRQFLITDFEPGEPGELFHRLNQHVRLTPAEKRNAFYGPVRIQVKNLVSKMESLGLEASTLGFSNSRMAYDDILSKFLLYLERGSLREKITEADITELFRRENGFDIKIVRGAVSVLETFALVVTKGASRTKFNKATFLSWLLFLYRVNFEHEDIKIPSMYLESFEYVRSALRRGKELEFSSSNIQLKNALYLHEPLLINLFNDRASSRVADVSSVIVRDYALHHCFYCAFRSLEWFDEKKLTPRIRLSSSEMALISNDVRLNSEQMEDGNVDLDKVFEIWGML